MSCRILRTQRCKLLFIFFLSYLGYQKVRSQTCQQSPSSYDIVSQNCVNCDSSCESCFGSLKNQCTKCKLDNLCEDKCENIFYQDSLTMECRKCSISGCAKCDSNNKCTECSQNLELTTNGQCYQKQQTCSSQQLYDPREGKCVQTCENNSIENQESKTCQNLSNCNIVNEYQSFQVKKNIERVILLSNLNVVLFEFPCRFYIADQYLQIFQFIELMPDDQFNLVLTNQINDIYFFQDDIIGCSGAKKLVAYDFVKEQYAYQIDITFPATGVIRSFLTNIQVIYYFLKDGTNQMAIIDLVTKKQNLVLKKESVQVFYTISIKRRMSIFYGYTSKKTYIHQILPDGTFQQYIVPILSFQRAYIANDELGIFACFVSSKLEVYQLNQGDILTVTLLYSISSLATFNNEILFLPTLNHMIISFMNLKYFNIYKIADDWKSQTLVSKVTSSVFIAVDGLSIVGSSAKKQLIMIRDLLQYCFLPLDTSSFKLANQDITSFSCGTYATETLPLIMKTYFIENKIYIFYRQTTTQLSLSLYTAEINNQQQTKKYYSTEGYTNFFLIAFSFSFQPPKQTIQQQTTLSLIDVTFGQKRLVSLENQLPLAYYQNNFQFRNIWMNEFVLGESNKFAQFQAFYNVENSKYLFYLQYLDDKNLCKMLIIDIRTFTIIFKREVPKSIQLSGPRAPKFIKKQNYILFLSYNILLDLNTNTLINNFSTDLSSSYFLYSISIEDKIVQIDNNDMQVKLYDLVQNKYTVLFQNYNYYYIEFVIQYTDTGKIELFTDQYLYFQIDMEKIQAFSLASNKFSTNVISSSTYHYSLNICFFGGVQNNEFFLFTSTKVIQFTSDLQKSQTYDFPISNTQLLYYFKYSNQSILSANIQALFKFDLITKKFLTVFTLVTTTSVQALFNLNFFGENNEYVLYSNLIINHQVAKVVQYFDKNLLLNRLINSKTETDTFTTLVDSNIYEMMFVRNIEKYPIYYYDLGNSQSRIIYKDNIKYLLYYYNPSSQKIIKQDLLSPITKTEFSFNHSFDLIVVDTLLDVFIFSDQNKYIYLFNPKDQSSQIKLLATYDQILKLDICEYQQTAIVMVSNTKIYNHFKLTEYNTYGCKPYYDVDNKVLIYPATESNQYIIIKDKTSSKVFVVCKEGVTDLNFDQNLNLVIIIEGKSRIISIFDGLTSVLKYSVTTVNYFNNSNYKIDNKSTLIIIVDLSPSLVIYDYSKNQLTNFALEYTKIIGFVVDVDKQYILFYDSNFIYIHKFPSIDFTGCIIDNKNPNSIINEIIINTNFNTLIVYRDTQAVLLYDLNQILNTNVLLQTQYLEIQNLKFDFDHYLIYNMRNRVLSLFQINVFKDIYFVNAADQNCILIGQLIKTNQNQFIYLNLDFMLFGQIDTVNSKIVKISENYNSISFKDFYLNKNSQTLILIESFTDNIYLLDLASISQTKLFNFILKVNNNNNYKFFRGFILKQSIIFYKDKYIYSYNIDDYTIKSKQISQDNNVSLLVKLQPPNQEIDVQNNNNSYLLDYLNTNEYDQNNLNVLVIINNDQKIKIIDSTSLSELYSVQVDYLIINVYIERKRNLIFLIGSRGKTHIFNYELKEMTQLPNPCLQQTKIQSDNFYIYSFCEKQLDVYNRITLQKAYPSQIIINSLNKVIYTQQKNIFILVSNKKIQVASLSTTSSTIQVLFQKDQKLLQILNFKTSFDINKNRYLEITCLSITDIVYYRVALEQSQICTYTYQQLNSDKQNNFSQKIIQLNMAYSNQLLKELRIQYKQDQQFTAPPIYGSISFDGLKVNIFSTKSVDNINQSLKWTDSTIFDKNQITSLQINSLNLIIQSNSNFVLNSQKNMLKLQMYEIDFLQINNPLIIQNYKKVILKNINFIQFTSQLTNDLISFINCEEIFIENLVISDSQFNSEHIFKFTNSNLITIKNFKLINSQIQSLFSITQAQQVLIDSLEILNLNIQLTLIEQTNTINTSFSTVSINKLIGGKFLKQLGCQQLSFDTFNIINSKSLMIIEVLQYVNIVIYQNLLTQIKNIIMQNSDDISFAFSSDKIEIQDLTINNSNLGQKHLFTIQAKQFSLINANFNEVKSQSDFSIFSIKNFDSVLFKNTKFIQNNIQLVELINQSQGDIIFESVQILDNSSQESLIQFQQSQSLEIVDSQFKRNTGKLNGGAISIQNMNTLKIQNSVFEQNISLKGKGGAIYLYDVFQTSMENTSFINNQSMYDNGGALYYFSSDMMQTCAQFSINKSSVLKLNKASAGKGGAIFLSTVNLQLDNVRIIENNAAIGGGIFYENIVPDIVFNQQKNALNEVSNNKATFFGQNFGSTLRKIKFNPNNKNQDSYFYSKQTKSNLFEIQNFQSGQYLTLSEINLLDEEQNLLDLKQMNNIQLNSIVQKELESISLSISNKNQKQQIVFQGGLVQKYSQNGFNFNISLNYKPSSENSLYLSSNIMSELKYPDGSYYIKESQISLEFQVSFRKCNLGEIKMQVLESTICENCPDGKYSLNENDLQCTICPITATRCQGSKIDLKEGYWRKNNDTDIIVQCSTQLISCQPLNTKSKFGCSEGYVGPLCEQCDYEGAVWGERYSYSFSAAQFCSKCSINVFYFAVNIVIFFLFQFIQIIFAIYRITGQVERYLSIYYMKVLGLLYLSNSEKSTQNPVHQKILIDHLQIISIASSFNLKLPTFFNYGSDVVGNPLQISSIAFDCFYSLEINKTIPYWFFKFIWSILLPLLIILSYLLFNKTKALLKLNHNNSRYNATAIIYIYLFYFPSMITLISKSINCRKIGDESYSQIDLTMSCREYDQHGKYIYFFILPFAIIFAVVLPFILYLKIKKERQNKVSRITSSRYKFLYEAFEDNLYFWEILRLGFKSCIMITSILLFEYLIIKACTISTILIAYYSLQMKFKPYKQSLINYLESQSTLICILTINLCLLYQQIVDINLILGQFTTVVIYLTNIYFILKLLLFIFLKPIPLEQEKRNFFQNFLFRMKQRFPQSLPFISIQLNISMKALLKIKIIKQNIKLLAQYRGEKMKNENNKFKKTIVKLLKNSTMKGGQTPRLQKLMLEDEANEYSKPVKTISNEVQPTEFGQLMLLQSRYMTRSPTINRKPSEFQLLRTEESQQSSQPTSPQTHAHSQFRTSSLSWQQTLITEDQLVEGDHIVEPTVTDQ